MFFILLYKVGNHSIQYHLLMTLCYNHSHVTNIVYTVSHLTAEFLLFTLISV